MPAPGPTGPWQPRTRPRRYTGTRRATRPRTPRVPTALAYYPPAQDPWFWGADTMILPAVEVSRG